MNLGAVLGAGLALLVLVRLDDSGGHLPAVLMALAVAQGSVLVVAAAELCHARWIAPLKRPLLALAPVQLLFPFLVRLAPYAWRDQPTAWLSERFFLMRGAGLLLFTALVACQYRRVTLAEQPRARRWAVVYILAFVVGHTVVAVDWVMSFDYPWISTMFPVLYLVEAFYAGLAVAGILAWRLAPRAGATTAGPPAYDIATLLFGFALFWAGLFFAQYLTIWYGNIPEEVAYFTDRFAHREGPALLAVVVLLLFVVPFLTLLVHRARHRPAVLFVLGNLVFLGLFLHRWFHLFPHLQPNAVGLGLELAAVICLLGGILRRNLPESAT